MGSIEKDFIRLKGLLCFAEVARCGQIKEAALRLHMKQSNLSTQIMSLEEDLKATLFNRHARGVSLTSSGKLFFQISCNLAKIMADVQNFSSVTHKVAGNIRLWVSEGMGSSYIPSCLADFYKTFPDVHLDILSSLKDPTSLSEFDVGIVYHKPQFNNAVEIFKGALHFYLYASKEYLVQNGYPKDLEDIKRNHRICLRNDFEDLWPKWRSFFDEVKNVAIRTDSSNLLFNLVNNGLGISFIPSCVAQKSENLMPVLEKEAHIEHPFWIICPRDLKDVPKIRVLMEHLKEIALKL